MAKQVWRIVRNLETGDATMEIRGKEAMPRVYLMDSDGDTSPIELQGIKGFSMTNGRVLTITIDADSVIHEVKD